VEAKPEDWGHKLINVEAQAEGYAAAKLKWFTNKEALPFVYEATGALT
jgi:type I restriction enzyme R subunit